MKRNQWHNNGLGTWVLTGVTSLLLAAAALGEVTVTQSNGIIVPDYPALPSAYPQELAISNLVGTISKVTLSLNNAKHAYASDLSALIVYKATNNVSGSVVLMSAAGGASEINGSILFDDAGSALPQFAQIGAGPYKPTDFANVTFPGSAATNAPYSNSLTSAFQGKNPNGKWSLYTYDTALVTAGQIGSWTVNVWTYPEIVTTNATLAINQNSSGTYYFTVKSSTTDAALLTVTAKSLNTSTIANTNIVVGGSGQNRTLTITPNNNQLAPATVEIVVSDTGGSTTNNLAVTITPVNQAPTIALSTNTVYTSAGVITVQVTANVGDFDNSPSDLKLQVTSSDDSIVFSNNVFFANTTLAARPFTVVPTGTASGTAVLTFKVSDTNNLSATSTLTVNVAPQTHLQYANTKVLGLSAAGTTNSSIAISNIAGKIGSATVSLTGLKNIVPNISEISLVAPGGNVLLLDSAVAGPNDYARVRFAAGAGSLPGTGSINEVSVGAPLGSLGDTSANGNWTLWVTNGGSSGVLVGGWLLDLFTAPSLTTTITNVVMNSQTETTTTFAIADIDGAITNASDVTVVSADATLVEATRTYDVAAKTGTVKFKSPTGKFGATTVTLTAKDNDNFTVSFVYNVAVNFVNHAPVISFIPKVDTTAGAPASTTFTTSDVDAPYTNQTITVTVRSSDQKLVPDGNLLITGAGANRTITMYPLGTNTGSATISVIANDGLASTTNQFPLNVASQGNPLYANLGQIQMFSTLAASPYPSPVTVSGLVGGVADVEVTLFGINNDIPDDMNVMLVSPNNKTNVLLMSHVGGSTALANTILTFSDAATGSLPDAGPIVSGEYKPTAVTSPIATPTFPSPAPTPRVGTLTNFAGLSGTNLNGAWSLYIYSDGLGRGVMVNGWQLSIRTAPSVQPIANQTIPKQGYNPTSTDVAISIGDDQPGVNIAVTSSPSPAGFITTAVLGTGGARTLRITPVAYQSNSNILVTVTATSTLGAPSTQTFNVNLYNVNLPPVISAIGGTTNSATAFASTTLTVWDPQGAPLTLSATADNKRLVPDGNITIELQGTANGTNSYKLTVLPADVQTGTARITVEASDNVGQKANAGFYAQVNPAPVFINGDGVILIPQGAPVAAIAQPNYPSKTVISGLDGYLTGVEVTLLGLSHQYPSDIDILLVSPNNRATILMAHAGGSTAVSQARISIADNGDVLTASDPLVNFDRNAPASFAASLDFEVPGVLPSAYKTNLASLTGTNTTPNGEWSLYVRDNTYPIGGQITNWILTLKTSPAFAPGSVVDQQTPENTTLAMPITVVSQSADPASLNVYAIAGTSSPTNLPGFNLVSSLQITNNGGGNRTLIITPTPNLPSSVTNVNGTVPILLQVVDGAITNVASFNLTVLWANQAPTIVSATNKLYLNENPRGGAQSSVEAVFTLSDADSRLFTSNAVVRFGDQTLIPDNTNNLFVTRTPAIIEKGQNGTVTVKLTPASEVSGTNLLTLTMTDGSASSPSVVTLNVASVYQPPYFDGVAASYSSPAGVTAGPYNFTVGSSEGVSAKSLLLSAKSSNTSLVPDSKIILGGTDAARSIQLTPVGTISGSSTITLTLIDSAGSKTNTTSFVLNVTAPAPGHFGYGQVVTVIGNPTNPPSWTYPIVFNVTNLVGPIYNVSLEMRGYSNSSPTDLDALLVAPDQTAVMLTSGGGGALTVDGLNLVFDDSGIEMPTVGPLASGTYHPSYYTKRVMPNSPATPTTPPTTNAYQNRMRAFEGKTAYTGEWKLYLNQQAAGTFAKISDGLFLKVTPAPQIVVTNPTIVLQENARGTLYFEVQDSLAVYGTNLTVTATSSDTALLPVGNPTSPQTNNAFQLPLNPTTYGFGGVDVTLTATRKSDGVSSSFLVRVTVAPVNFLPTISRLLPVTTPASTPVSIQFLVSDPDSDISRTNFMVEASSDNPAVLPSTNLVFAASGTNVIKGLPKSIVSGTSELVFTMNPVQFAVGSANVTIKVTDSLAVGTNIVTSNFVFTAESRIFDPYLGPVADQSVIAGRSTATISFPAGSQNIIPPDLQVTGASSDLTLIANSGIVVNPAAGGVSVSAWSVTVTALPQSGGFSPKTAAVTLSIRDKTNNRTNTTSFNVTVLPPPVYTFASTRSIAIVDNAKANPYPGQVEVTGLVGNVSKVSATLTGFSHRYPADANLLLVAPNGTTKVVLMNKAGGGTPIVATNAVNLTFDMSAASPIPQGITLTTGSWKPANYNASFNFPDAPAGPYSTDLSVFNGVQANGTWSLYVFDDSPPDAGAIQGWTLSIETQPAVTLSTNYLVMNMNTTNEVGISIQDDAPAGTYKFGATATNATLIPSSGVTFSGSGQKYTATIRPAANQFGTNELTIWTTNILNQYVSNKLLVNVLLVTNAPVILPVAPQSIVQAQVGSVDFAFGDALVPQNQLSVSFASSNPDLIPNTNIRLANPLSANVGVTTNSLQFLAAGDKTGKADITVTVTAPANRGGLSSTSTFTVTVLLSPTPVFANNRSITIADRAPGNPYPSIISVSNVVGKVMSVSLDINGLTHSYPADVSMLLVGPQGLKVVLMSRAGNGIGLTGANFKFDQAAGSPMPQNSAIVTGTAYQPANYNPALSFYAGPPTNGPIVTNLNVFNNTDPNGTWSLYVQDDQSPDAGSIANGWTLRLVTTAPTIAAVPAQVTPENSSLLVPITVSSPVVASSNLTVTVSSSGSSPANLLASVTVTMNPTNKSLGTVSIVPTADLPSAVSDTNGTSTITLNVTDGTNSVATSFPLTVLYVNQPPKFVGLGNLSTPANLGVSQAFSLTDVDSTSSAVVVTGLSTSNTNLGTATVASSASGYVFSFVPVGDQGTTTIKLIATDGVNFTTNSFTVTATPGAAPVIAFVAPITMAEATSNVTVTADLSISNSTPEMTLISQSSNPALGTARNTGSGGKWTVYLDVAAHANGETIITLIASTKYGSATNFFKVTVTPVDYSPSIGAIAPQTTTANVPVTVALPITDSDTPIGQLTVTAVSSDTALVTSIQIANDGTNVSATLNVAACNIGVATITVSVMDGASSVTNSFLLTVVAPAAPVIAPIADITETNAAITTITVPVLIQSPIKPISALTITASSSNTNLVSNVVVSVSGTNVTALLTLVNGAKGSSTITISVNDCVSTVTESFAVIVPNPLPATMTATFKNGVLTIRLSGGAGTVYTIQNSINMVTWTDVTTVTADANGNASYNVNIAGQPDVGFYRSVIK